MKKITSIESVTYRVMSLMVSYKTWTSETKLGLVFCQQSGVLEIYFDGNVKSICLKKAKNLIDLTLINDANDIWVSGLIKSLPKNMQRFSIGSYDLTEKISYADIIPLTLVKSSFKSIKYLKLGNLKLDERGELLYIVSVLKSAPHLVEFVTESNTHSNEDHITQARVCSEELECSNGCLNQLQIVNIIVEFSSQQAMSLLRFILVNSTSLKTLTFKVGFSYQKLDAPLLAMASISQELLLMERASPRAQVKFLPSL
ncbi:unnamed protein product [Trifolium pratense]|uniref:Uncharacterized protein n=1 Tax=Trifolium pratense TaxID=57577 RepID=A0ACB0LT01_TRIPR|nr:unnamed protein product [Trifolium pratense]